MKRVRLVVIVLLPLLWLTACGEIRHVFPPSVSVDQLSTPATGPWSATLRLHNQSYDAAVRFEAVHIKLDINGSAAGQLDKTLELDVAKRDSDVALVEFQPTAAAREALGSSPEAQLHYSISGQVVISDEGEHATDFSIEHTAWLSPTPGMPHLYR